MTNRQHPQKTVLSGGAIDLLSPEAIANPYPTYKKLQDEDPIHWYEPMQAWVITRYDDVTSIALNPGVTANIKRMGKLIELFPEYQERLRKIEDFENSTVTFRNPEDHKRVRDQLKPHYTASALAVTRRRLESDIDQILDQLGSNTTIDFQKDFAAPLTMKILTGHLNLSEIDPVLAGNWIIAFASLNLQNISQNPDKVISNFEDLHADLVDQIKTIIEARRDDPQDGAISLWLANQAMSDGLSDDELITIILSQIAAGSTSIADSLSSGLLLLLENPEQLEALRKDGGLIKGAVSECLRHAGSTQCMLRRALEPLEIHGQTIQTGDMIILGVGAANMDPRRFPEPHVFDIYRKAYRNIAFGHGAHLCPGRSLAIMTMEIAYIKLLQRFPNMRLAIPADQVSWKSSLITRALNGLPITFQ